MYPAQQERAFFDLAWHPKLTRRASKGRASQKSCCWSNSIICIWLCWSGYSLVRPLLTRRVGLAGKDHPKFRNEPICIMDHPVIRHEPYSLRGSEASNTSLGKTMSPGGVRGNERGGYGIRSRIRPKITCVFLATYIQPVMNETFD